MIITQYIGEKTNEEVENFIKPTELFLVSKMFYLLKPDVKTLLE